MDVTSEKKSVSTVLNGALKNHRKNELAPKLLRMTEHLRIQLYDNSAFKKNKTLSFATIWVDLEGIMLSEIVQTETNTI